MTLFLSAPVGEQFVLDFCKFLLLLLDLPSYFLVSVVLVRVG